MKKFAVAFSVLSLLVSGATLASAQADTCVTLTHDMTVGATDATTGGEVTLLQNFLNDKGFYKFKTDGRTGTIVGIGIFGPQTANGVMAFQRHYGITPTGYVGSLTRSNIQTLTCAVGVAQTIVNGITDTASTTSAATHTLLSFAAPAKGDLVIKGEKDLSVDWTLSSSTSIFPAQYTRLNVDLVDTSGQTVDFVGHGVSLANSHGDHRITGQFQSTLQRASGKNKGDTIPSGGYKLRASIVYTPATPLCSATVTTGCVTAYSAADQALIALAATYGTDSPWFYIVDPAPKATIKMTVSTTTIPTAQPVTLTWTITPSTATNCLFTDPAASSTQSIGLTGTKIVTPAQTSTYKITCDLTSEWPLAGMSYTTNAQAQRKITVGTTIPANCTATQTLVNGVCTDNTSATSSPAISVVYPNGGEKIVVRGKSVDFRATWTSTNLSGNVSVYLNSSDGSTCLLGSVPVAKENFPVTLADASGAPYQCPNIPRTITTGSYKILLDTDTPASDPNSVLGVHDSSDDYFTVTQASTATTTPSATLDEPSFTGTCSRAAGNTFQITLRWNRVDGATNYPVRLQGPSFATNAVQFNGESVVGFNNPGTVDNPSAPTGTSYTFRGLTQAGDYTYWGHAWKADGSAAGMWSTDTVKTVTCSSRTAVLGAATACVDLSANLHRGAESSDVSSLQSFLKDQGFLGVDPTGFYGDMTVAAVKAYQSSHDLPVTGMVYEFTRQALKADSCQ